MGRNLPNVTETEWTVLERLWECGPATVRQLTDALYPRGGASEYATVHKLLERLETKGYVGRGRKGGVIVFHAAVSRDEVVGQQIETLVEKSCGGSLQVLLSNLIRVRQLRSGELRELIDLVDRLDKRSQARKQPRGEG